VVRPRLFDRLDEARGRRLTTVEPDRSHRRGSTVPIKLRVCDAAGGNLSSASLPLTARGVFLVATNAPGQLEDSGNANPDQGFRYDAALEGYIYNLSTRGLPTGTYELRFTVGVEAHQYSAGFQVR
jgi:hypothetical protein